jgi:anti-sigma regulatory factor (Ser/Thr protein kinase)
MATLSLFADLSHLTTIREFVARSARELGLDERALYDLQLAVDEASTNVVQHAYGGQGGQIEVTVEPAEDGVRVKVRDWGTAFDPQAVPVPDVTAPLGERKLGGLGLFIIHQVMADVRFEFDAQQGNTLTMVVRKRGGGEEDPWT